MGTYYLIILLLLLAGIATHYSSYENKDMIYIIFAFLLLTFFSANRFATGYDYGAYASLYHRYAVMYFEQLYTFTQEKGYAVLNHFLGFFTMDYKLLFQVTSVFCVGLVSWYLYRNSKIVWLSVFLFFILGFYYMSYNFIRQFMAAVIMLYGFRYVFEKDFLRYVLFVSLAGCFHLSAFILIPFYFLFQLPLNKWMVLIYFLGGAFCFLYSEPILSFITQYVYTSYDPLTAKEMVKGIPFWYVIPFILVFAFAYPIRKDLLLQDPKNDFYLSALFFILMFEWVALKHGLISRFILLFMIPAMCILIPNVMLVYYEKYFRQRKKLGYAVLAVLFALSIINHQAFMKDNYNGVVPYKTYAEREGGKEG